MNNNDFNKGLLDFIQQSPTPFHAVQNMVNTLESAGFQRLDEKEQLFVQQKQMEGRYFVTRNDSSIVAFDFHKHFVRVALGTWNRQCLFGDKPN